MNVLMLLFKDIHYDARVKREAAALAQAGHRVFIACLAEHDHPPPSLGEGVELWRYEIRTKRIKRRVTQAEGRAASRTPLLLRLARLPVLKLFKDIAASQEFYRLTAADLARQPIDVIHCHDLNTLPAGSRLARRFKAKLVYDSHELFNEMAGKNWLEKQIGYLVERMLMKRVDHLIVVNPYVQRIFNRRYGLRPTTVVQNVPEAPDFAEKPPQEIVDLREYYGLEPHDVLLLYQGGLNPERGLEESLQALALLPESFKLVLIGEGRLKERLQQLAEELGIDKRLFFHGQVPSEELLWYTKQADVGLVMYRNTSLNNYYSTPNKIFEYLQAGIPTVSSDHPGKRYIVEKEETGVCVAETPQAIKDGILDVLTRQDHFRESCLAKRDRFTWEREQEKLVKAYRQLKGRSR